MSSILLLSKTKDMGRIISRKLEDTGYDVILMTDLKLPVAILAVENIKAVLLEMLTEAPEMGWSAQLIKNHPRLGKLPLIALIGEDDIGRIKTVELIDELIVYPCNPTELSLRIKMALRKHQDDDDEDVIKIGDLIINPTCYEVTIDGSIIPLTHKEFELLKFLARNSGKVFARQTLVKKVWRNDYDGGIRTVDVHVRRLRVKLGKYSNLITTVKNVGYRFSGQISNVIPS